MQPGCFRCIHLIEQFKSQSRQPFAGHFMAREGVGDGRERYCDLIHKIPVYATGSDELAGRSNCTFSVNASNFERLSI